MFIIVDNDNAIKYNQPGGMVKVTDAQKSGEVLLSVQDTGIGISPEHRKRSTMRTLPTPVNLCDNRLHLEKLEFQFFKNTQVGCDQ